jgi:hypothetical protein
VLRENGSHLNNKIKVKRLLVASAVIVPPAPNLVPPAAVHPLQEVKQAVPWSPLPPAVQGQPPTPAAHQQQFMCKKMVIVKTLLLYNLWIHSYFWCSNDIPKRPMDDLMEGMPLDCSFNNNLKISTTIHVIHMVALQGNNKGNSVLAHPNGALIWNLALTGKAGKDQHNGGVPCGWPIIQDITQVIDSYKRIDREAHGMFVVGLGNSNRRRGDQRRVTGVKSCMLREMNNYDATGTVFQDWQVALPRYDSCHGPGHPAIRASSQ